ncbi:MAG: response regulator [Pseudobdellovibrionaceae bacterium]|nr:response regulator [Pseudobdellovibrionaceae bacterium]
MKNDEKLILLVDDNADDRELAIEALSDIQFTNEIIVARNGFEALDFLFCKGRFASRISNKMPQLILLDLKLPKIDGFEVLRQIRSSERTRLIPTVILSSSRQDNDISMGYRLGANSYVRKPVDFVEFTRTLKDLFLYWLSINQHVYPKH